MLKIALIITGILVLLFVILAIYSACVMSSRCNKTGINFIINEGGRHR